MILGWFGLTYSFFPPCPWQEDKQAITKEQLGMEVTLDKSEEFISHAEVFSWNRLSFKIYVLTH